MTWRSPDGLVELVCGDAREVLAGMEAESVSCCVTSPPFWGLRSYECESTIWGGDPECPHRLEAQPVDGETYAGRKRWQHDGVSRQETPEAWVKGTVKRSAGGEREYGSHDGGTGRGPSPREPEHATCSLCGAWRGVLGNEPTVAMYVQHTLDWLRAVRRVLRKDGVVWVDIDDSRGAHGSRLPDQKRKNVATTPGRMPADIKPKSLALIPQRLAIACQEDGWIVRSVIVITSWMPESAKDRPTDAYRTLLMLTRQGRYWSDFHAVRVEATGPDPWGKRPAYEEPYGHLGESSILGNLSYTERMARQDGLRNLGNVWDDIGPAAYPDAHFATFSLREPERCILASCPMICQNCGLPDICVKARKGRRRGYYTPLERRLIRRFERRFGSLHGGPFESLLVLDPFVGTGTTLIAARRLGRRSIGIDLSPDYIAQARTRLLVGDAGVRRLVEAGRHGLRQLTLEEP